MLSFRLSQRRVPGTIARAQPNHIHSDVRVIGSR